MRRRELLRWQLLLHGQSLSKLNQLGILQSLSCASVLRVGPGSSSGFTINKLTFDEIFSARARCIDYRTVYGRRTLGGGTRAPGIVVHTMMQRAGPPCADGGAWRGLSVAHGMPIWPMAEQEQRDAGKLSELRNSPTRASRPLF